MLFRSENRISNSNASRNNSEEMRGSKNKAERTSKSINNNIENREIKAINTPVTENRENSPITETRHSNSTLRDLIKILILNQILGNRPRPPRPPRPPFPGGRPPMGPGGRPPIIQPREYPDYLEF